MAWGFPVCLRVVMVEDEEVVLVVRGEGLGWG